jgi:hypothetical protein
LATLWQIS